VQELGRKKENDVSNRSAGRRLAAQDKGCSSCSGPVSKDLTSMAAALSILGTAAILLFQWLSPLWARRTLLRVAGPRVTCR
jgi:hypothetical protein